MEPHHDLSDTAEEFESIPWDSLLADDTGGRRRRVGLVGAGIAVVVMSAAVGRLLWQAPAPPTLPTSPSTTTGLPAVAQPVETAPTTSLPVTEADLMATDADELRVSAGSYAAMWVAETFTRLGPPHSFVESVHPLETRDVGDGRVAVVVAFRTLEDSGEGYTRMPLRAAEVVVDMTTDPPGLVDHPSPVEPPLGRFEPPAVEPADPPAHLIDAASSLASSWGTGEVVHAGTEGGRWRFEMTVTDRAGLTWTAAIWLDEAGDPVPPPG